MDFFSRKPPLGSPQNPEIIEPGQRPRNLRGPSRLTVILSLLKIMVGVSLPAIFFDIVVLWLIDLTRAPEGILAWIFLILTAPPALLFTLVAVVANLVLSVVFVLTLFGKPVNLRVLSR